MARTIELFYDADWHDVTSGGYVLLDDTISVELGTGAESDEPAAGKLTFSLLDPDKIGRWSNRIPGGVNYRKLGRNTPVRFAVDGDVRCVMEIPEWQPRWELNGAKVRTAINAAGIFQRLTEGARTLRPPAERALIAVLPLVLWPMTDGASAAAAASAVSGVRPMAASGTVGFAEVTGPLGQGNTPEFLDDDGAIAGYLNGAVPDYAATDHWQIDVAFRAVPDADGGTNQGVSPISVDIVDTAKFARCKLSVIHNNGFGTATINVNLYDSINNTVIFLSSVQQVVDGAWHHVAVKLEQTGANFDAALWVDGVEVATDTDSGSIGRPAVAHIPGPPAENTFDPLLSLSVAYFAVINTDVPPVDLYQAFIGYTGETAGRRIERLLGEHGVTFASVGDLDETPPMGPQTTDTLMANLQSARRVDQGLLLETRTELGVTYRTFAALVNQPGPALDYAAGHVVPPLEPDESISPVRNYVPATRPGGSTAVSTLAAPTDAYHRLSTQPHPDGVGEYDRGEVDVQSEGDDRPQHVADWIRHLGTWDEYRYPTLTVELAAEPWTTDDVALAAAVAALGPGDRLTLDNLPAWLPPELVALQVRGMVEAVTEATRTITFNLAPGWPWEVWQLESGGAALVVGRDTDDTSFKISTSSGPPFKTGAPLGTPYYVQAAGEAVKVTTMATDTPAYIGVGTGSTANGGNTSPTLPAGITADVGQLLKLFAWTDGAAATVDTPSGWTLKAGTASGKLRVFTRYYVTGVSAPTVTYTGDGAGDINAAFICAYSGLSDQLDDGRYRARYPSPQRQVNSSAANIAVPALSVRRDGCVVFAVGARTEDWTSVATLSGFTREILELDDGTGNRAGIVADALEQSTATDVAATAFVVTGGIAGTGEALIYALRPLQTATVVRGVNGAAASPAAGEPIYGWRLGVLGL